MCGDDRCDSTENCLSCSDDCPCAAGSSCDAATASCRTDCTPDCGNRSCGNDGCGGSCGRCGDGTFCASAGRCELEPEGCGNGRCDGDESCLSCAGDCSCAAGEICDAASASCQEAPMQGCGDGRCDTDESCATCDADCACAEGQVCDAATARCVTPPCMPECDGRECGDDGCGGHCGECARTHTCTAASGQCERVCEAPPLLTDTQLDLDLRPVTLRGQVRIDGEPAQANRSMKLELFNLRVGGAVETAVRAEAEIAGRFSALLLPGLHAAALSGEARGSHPELRGTSRWPLADIEVAGDTVHEIELSTARLSGIVSVDGIPVDAEQTRNLALRFRNLSGGAEDEVQLSAGGRYEIRLPVGDYEVSWKQSYHHPDTLRLPRGRFVLRESFHLDSDAVLDIDGTPIVLSGRVTLDGRPLHQTARCAGAVYLVDTQYGTRHGAGLSCGENDDFQIMVLPGTYTMDFDPSSLTAPFPRPLRFLRAGELTLNEDQQVDLDLRRIDVEGSLTLSGTLPDAPIESVDLRVLQVETGESLTLHLAKQGEAYPFSTPLFPGRYRFFMSFPSRIRGALRLPRGERPLGEEVSLSADADLDFAAQLARPTIHLSVDGAPLELETGGPHGVLRLRSLADATQGVSELQAASDGRLSTWLHVFAGPHDIVVDGTSVAEAGPLPQQSVTLSAGENLSGQPVIELDMPTVRVHGTVTVHGAPMPDHTQSRGTVFLDHVNGQRVEIALPASGPATYEARVAAGAYRAGLVGRMPEVLPSMEMGLIRPCFESSGDCGDDLTGSWRVDSSFQYLDGPNLELIQEGDQLSGVVSNERSGDFVPGYRFTGENRGGLVHFRIRWVNSSTIADFRGRLDGGGCRIDGSVQVARGRFPFSATRMDR